MHAKYYIQFYNFGIREIDETFCLLALHESTIENWFEYEIHNVFHSYLFIPKYVAIVQSAITQKHTFW